MGYVTHADSVNLATGVTGFKKELKFSVTTAPGFRGNAQTELGYSHDVDYRS
jgi:hypothetical protein